MTTQALQELNPAQELIYTRTNLRRANPDFDDTDIAGIYLQDQACVVVRRDGSQQSYDRQGCKDAFLSYTTRLKDFFSYLGPDYRGPSIWRDNAYVIFKGWHYVHQHGKRTSNAMLQRQWADKFMRLTDSRKLITLLQSDQTDLGHLVAPDGMRLPERPIDLNADLNDEQDQQQPILSEPYCSCGSFQRQLNNLEGLQAEIEGYKPRCIHLTWFNKYRDLLCRRTEVRNASPSGTPDKCVAWWYAPPADHTSDGRFMLLHTTRGAQAPLTHWRHYKPKEIFTQHHAWDLFNSMADAGYVPFPGTSLPQLNNAFKDNE